MTVQEAIAGLYKACGGADGLTAELCIIHCENGERKLIVPVAFGMVPFNDTFAIAVVTEEEMKRLIEKNGGKLPKIGDVTTA